MSEYPQILVCNVCTVVFHNNWGLKNHMSETHGKTMLFTCGVCDRGFDSKSGLQHHHSKVHKGTLINCPICEYSTAFRWNLKKHMKRKHKVSQCFSCMNVYPFETTDMHICK